jgi:hypothetical protein
VANWEQHILPGLLTKPGEELADLLGEPLPADAQPSRTYFGNPRLIVPTLRRDLTQGDPLTLKVILLAGDSPSEAALYWRPMGAGGFNRIPLQHVARGVYSVTLPAAATQADLEYHVRAALPDGRSAQFPVTAPAINQTVVVVPPRA